MSLLNADTTVPSRFRIALVIAPAQRNIALIKNKSAENIGFPFPKELNAAINERGAKM